MDLHFGVPEKFEKGVAWVTLNKGDPTVKIRLHGENSAADAIKKLEGKLTIGEVREAGLILTSVLFYQKDCPFLDLIFFVFFITTTERGGAQIGRR